MQLLCLGDIAIFNNPTQPWPPPGGIAPGEERRILFNWELPIGTKINAAPRTSGPRLMSNSNAVDVIRKWIPGFATLATNHILDAGVDGLAETISVLQKAGFQTVGAGLSIGEIMKPLIWETNEGRLAIVNWVFPETHPDWRYVPGANCWPGVPEAKRIIQALKQSSDWVLIVVHWSDELFPYPRPVDREIAHEMARMGATFVIGHHPHVVRGLENIGSCPVFYSIGNYFFDENMTNEGDWIFREAPRNREGLAVRLTFRHDQNPKYELLSFWNNKRESILDSACRASRRVKSTSIALQRCSGESYINWYKRERARFVKFDSRWHFGLLRMGVFYSFRKIFMKSKKLVTMPR